MTKLSQDHVARASKIQSTILKRLAERKHCNLAVEIDVDESTISRFVSGRLEQLALILAGLNLKVISEDDQVISWEEKRYLMKIARDHFDAELAHADIVEKSKS